MKIRVIIRKNNKKYNFGRFYSIFGHWYKITNIFESTSKSFETNFSSEEFKSQNISTQVSSQEFFSSHKIFRPKFRVKNFSQVTKYFESRIFFKSQNISTKLFRPKIFRTFFTPITRQ